MFTAWIVFHVFTCISLVLVVLMQSSKGEGLAGSAFGGGSGGGIGGAVFGGRGAASFLSNATTVLAILFMINCAGLAVLSTNQKNAAANLTGSATSSIVTQEAQKEALQRQQLQQQQAQDNSAPLDIKIIPNESAGDNTTSTDTSGN